MQTTATPRFPLPQGVSVGGLGSEAFRVTDEDEVLALLKAMMEAGTVLNLAASDGTTHSATLWAVDPRQRRLALTADLMSTAIPRLIEAAEVVATGYLDHVRIQFELGDCMLVHGPRASVLQARVPPEVYRFQRRAHPRVRTLDGTAPTASFRHPQMADMRLDLRVLDMSVGGCALLLPHDVPVVPPGVRINGAKLQLDADTRIKAALMVHHVTSIGQTDDGVRLGCELLELDATSERALQRYIDLTQKRRRVLSRE